jgi:hypothetical protein
VKEFIANQASWSNGYKQGVAYAYNSYAEVNGLRWSLPHFRVEDKLPKIPTEEKINQIIVRARGKYVLVFSILRDTGMRPMHACMIFVLNAMMIMFGYLMEKINQYTEKTDWSSFILGCISGGTPWIAIYAYFIAAISSVSQNVPTFVYLILFIYFILFNIFAVNMVLQYKGIGRWKDYLYGERIYIILSFVAKSILAWLVFVGIYAPF